MNRTRAVIAFASAGLFSFAVSCTADLNDLNACYALSQAYCAKALQCNPSATFPSGKPCVATKEQVTLTGSSTGNNCGLGGSANVADCVAAIDALACGAAVVSTPQSTPCGQLSVQLPPSTGGGGDAGGSPGDDGGTIASDSGAVPLDATMGTDTSTPCVGNCGHLLRASGSPVTAISAGVGYAAWSTALGTFTQAFTTPTPNSVKGTGEVVALGGSPLSPGFADVASGYVLYSAGGVQGTITPSFTPYALGSDASGYIYALDTQGLVYEVLPPATSFNQLYYASPSSGFGTNSSAPGVIWTYGNRLYAGRNSSYTTFAPANLPAAPMALAVDDSLSNAYAVVSGSLLVIPAGASTYSSVIGAQPRAGAQAIAATGSYVYWISSLDGSLHQSTAGGSDTTLDPAKVTLVSAANGHVVWAEATGSVYVSPYP